MPGMIRATRWLTILSTLPCLISATRARGQEPDRTASAPARIVWPGQEWQTADSRKPGILRRGTRCRRGICSEVRWWQRLHHPPRLPREGVGRSSKAGRHQIGDQGGRGNDHSGVGCESRPGHARRPGREALSSNRRHWPLRIPKRPARRDHDPPSRHDDRGLRRRPAAQAGVPARHGWHLFERLRQHAGRAAHTPIRRRPGRSAQARSDGPYRRAARGVEVARQRVPAKTINVLRSREFASGITITHRALARIGYLYLREGDWNGRRILSREFIRTATRPTDLPSFVPYYAFYWGSNGRGTFREYADRHLLGARPGR